MASTQVTLFESYRNSALSNTKILVRAGGTSTFGWNINNPDTADVYVNMFNAATTAAVTLGATAPVLSVKVPNAGSVYISPDKETHYFPLGLVITSQPAEISIAAPGTATSITLYFK